jgi:methyl-accepting chemotaxis protein
VSRSTDRAARSTFGRRLTRGSALIVALAMLMGAASVAVLITVTRNKDALVTIGVGELSSSQQLSVLLEQRIGDYRAFLLNGDEQYLTTVNQEREEFLATIGFLRTDVRDRIALGLLDRVSEAEATYARLSAPVMERRKAIKNLTDIAQLSATDVAPARESLQDSVEAFVTRIRGVLEAAIAASSRTTSTAITFVCVLDALAVALTALIGVRLNRQFSREIGAAVVCIQDSSMRLEAAAVEQAVGGHDQTGAMDQITARIGELLITSRRIADHARQVSEITGNILRAASTGDTTIDEAGASIAELRVQVDQIATRIHALDEWAQQVGGVTGLVSELAEHTNILTVNATIEADGSGERFLVVAAEIRKLADHTAESAKQIRALIDDVRDAVSTTVAATETGARAVDTAAQRLSAATASFRKVAALVSTASDASNEIEQSTKEQRTAVEQINIAAGDTARVTRRTAATATQTQQTAEQLSSLSRDLQQRVGAGGGQASR